MQDKQIKVVMHESVSLDGSFINFEFSPDLMSLHYEIAATFGPTIRLIGSNTARVSMEMFGGFEEERPEDFLKPEKASAAAPWVFVDSKAVLKDRLHYFRRSEYCGDVAVLVAKDTPPEYIDYLQARHYDFFASGEEQVALPQALSWMVDCFGIRTVMTDAGSGLTNALLNQGLLDQISLLTVPTIVGCAAQNLFQHVTNPVKLSLVTTKSYPGGYVWSLYQVQDRPQQ